MVTPGHDASKVEGMQPVQTRRITVKFNADTASSMQWKFRPQQPKVDVSPFFRTSLILFWALRL